MFEAIFSKLGYISKVKSNHEIFRLRQDYFLQSELLEQKETTIQQMAEQLRKYAPIPKKRGRPRKALV